MILRSGAIWLAFTIAWLAWPDLDRSKVDRLVLMYGFAAAGLVLIAWRSAAPAIAVAAVVAISVIRLGAADLLAAAGAGRAKLHDDSTAAVLYRQSVQRDSTNDVAFLRLGEALMQQADSIADPSARRRLLLEARDALRGARGSNPFEYHHARNLAAIERRLAREAAVPVRRQHQDEAERQYRIATEMAPSSGTLWAEWGNLDAERGRMNEAFEKLERAAGLGATLASLAVADAILRATGNDLSRPDVLQVIAGDLNRRGHLELSKLYTTRATASATLAPPVAR